MTALCLSIKGLDEFFDSDGESSNCQSDYFIGSIKSSEPEPIKPLEADALFQTIIKRQGKINIVNILTAFADQFDDDHHWTIIVASIEKSGQIERKLALYCPQTGDMVIINESRFGRKQRETLINLENNRLISLAEPPPNLFWYELTEGLGMAAPSIKRAKTQLKARSSSGICSFVLLL